jgi:hypothetical protein
MDGGRAVEYGSAEQMKNPKTEFGRAFLSLWNA